MINSILVNELLYERLTGSDSLKSIVGDKIFPIIADNNVTFPFVVFKRNSIQSAGSKDGIYDDVVEFSIAAASTSYFETLTIANVIRSVIEVPHFHNSKIECDDILMTDIEEQFIDECYVQRLSFSCHCRNITDKN